MSAASPWVVGALTREPLDAASWVDVGRGWLRDPQEVYDALATGLAWQQGTVWRYDHRWSEPRLHASARGGRLAPHPALAEADTALRRLYRVPLEGMGLSFYRDGRDAMGAHRDSDMRWCDETVIAVLTLGATRPWTLQPAHSSGAARDVLPGSGDLLVMGGRAQADWLHGVPPVRGLTTGRISVQWRWTSRRGRPERGGSSTAARTYGGGR